MSKPMTDRQKTKLGFDVADRFYELSEPKPPANADGLTSWPRAFAFRSYAVRVNEKSWGYALSIYDRHGRFVTNIAA